MPNSKAEVRLRFRALLGHDIDQIEEDLASEQGTGEFQWFGFTPTQGIRQRLGESGLLGSDGGMLAVVDAEADGIVVGRVEWFRAAWGRTETSWCWTIAVAVRPGFRGRGIGKAAHRLLIDYLFLHTRAERLQAYTDAHNVAEQRALISAGFAQEGVLRAAQWRNGSWRDQLLFSIIRSSWST
jgi:aminoglycoside 6'-N-acetyltransferase